MMHGGYEMFGGGGILGLIIVIIIGYFLIKYFNENNNSNTSNSYRKSNPLDILNERYARGEIDEEEYNRKKKILKE
ncbi:MAG: SHOCT domain-containing protein [Senegalia sp. (in: firmicutes)]|uniref:SHOCT domain-containing protein n=1 Tax=Senegalia sp. (in: firmicutes) TaxID=1924098 RepID=UPI003F95E042